jgi:hypothetical protein
MTTREAKHAVRLQEWGKMVELCQTSPLTVSEWCNQNGIKPACYYYRLTQVRKALLDHNSVIPSDVHTPTMPTLVKVPLSPPEQNRFPAPEASGERFFRLSYHSAVLDIPVGTCAEDIAEVFKAMEQSAF